MNKNLVTINVKEILDAAKARSVIAKHSHKYGQKSAQSIRWIMNATVLISVLGGKFMNQSIHGYDAFLWDGTPMENKNSHAEIKKHTVVFQDVTAETLHNIAVSNTILSLSGWGNEIYPDWILVGSTKQIKEQLISSYNPNAKRPNCRASFQYCFEHGFKLVILGDKEEVINKLSVKYPTLADKFNFDDILCTTEEAQAFIASIL